MLLTEKKGIEKAFAGTKELSNYEITQLYGQDKVFDYKSMKILNTEQHCYWYFNDLEVHVLPCLV